MELRIYFQIFEKCIQYEGISINIPVSTITDSIWWRDLISHARAHMILMTCSVQALVVYLAMVRIYYSGNIDGLRLILCNVAVHKNAFVVEIRRFSSGVLRSTWQQLRYLNLDELENMKLLKTILREVNLGINSNTHMHMGLETSKTFTIWGPYTRKLFILGSVRISTHGFEKFWGIFGRRWYQRKWGFRLTFTTW